MKTIKELIKQFTDLSKKKNIPLYYGNEYGVDGDIFAWLPNASVSAVPFPKGKWISVDTTNGTTEKEMLKIAQKMCLSQAIQSFTAELEAGTFDAKETYRIIFLEETDAQGNSLKLFCFRDSDGELDLYVSQVNPDDGWSDAGRAWLATNTQTLTSDTEALSSLDTLTDEQAIKHLKIAGYRITKEEIVIKEF